MRVSFSYMRYGCRFSPRLSWSATHVQVVQQIRLLRAEEGQQVGVLARAVPERADVDAHHFRRVDDLRRDENTSLCEIRQRWSVSARPLNLLAQCDAIHAAKDDVRGHTSRCPCDAHDRDTSHGGIANSPCRDSTSLRRTRASAAG